jgi:hypothetical protein
MACSFSIEFAQAADRVIAKAENAITRAGGKFSGDSISGKFSISAGIGSIRGAYTIQNNLMNVEIEDKPVFISCSRIENEIRKYLTEEYA